MCLCIAFGLTAYQFCHCMRVFVFWGLCTLKPRCFMRRAGSVRRLMTRHMQLATAMASSARARCPHAPGTPMAQGSGTCTTCMASLRALQLQRQQQRSLTSVRLY